MVTPEIDPIPISAIEHYAYCARQCAIIAVEGVWRDNVHTVRGQTGHRRADDSSASRVERGRQVLRAVPLWSERLELTGRADVVEVDRSGNIFPVEYKMGVRHGDAAHLQLCAQGLCLEEMTGQHIAQGALWFAGPRRRVVVDLDDELRAQTIAVIGQIRSIMLQGTLPPAPNDTRCNECQLIGYCMPAVVSKPGQIIAYNQEVARCES